MDGCTLLAAAPCFPPHLPPPPVLPPCCNSASCHAFEQGSPSSSSPTDKKNTKVKCASRLQQLAHLRLLRCRTAGMRCGGIASIPSPPSWEAGCRMHAARGRMQCLQIRCRSPSECRYFCLYRGSSDHAASCP